MPNSNRKLIDLTGQTFGKLTVTQEGVPVYDAKDGKPAYQRVRTWMCECACGVVTTVRHRNLMTGQTTSCGCSHKAQVGAMNRTHGQTGTRLYKVWKGIRRRCNNPQDEQFRHYGGRGIKVCKRWDDFTLFAQDMGERPEGDYSIDRINVNGDYAPENCKWATRMEQGCNKRNNHLMTLNGETLTISQWSRKLNISFTTIYLRLRKNLPIHEVLRPTK